MATNWPVFVADTLPTGLTATALKGTGWGCAMQTLTCQRHDVLAPGAAWPPITLYVNVAANAPGSVTNTATVSGGGSVTNTTSDPTTIGPAPN